MHNQWIEIFRAGTHTDMGGNSRAWSEADLDQIVTSYNPGHHEAPAVVGHPKDNHPAFGWVESLKREGLTLFAKFKDIVPEFAEAVRAGQYKKRSIALYPDLSLRHVGFLGAMPPAVKGLGNIAFSVEDGEAVIIEFGDNALADIPALPEGATDMDDKERIKELEDKLAESANETAAALATANAFAESEKAKDAELVRIKADAEDKENLAFCEKLVESGKLPVGLKDQAVSLLSASAPGFQFGEGKTMRADMLAFLEGLPEFDPSELAKRSAAKADKKEMTPHEIAEKARVYMEESTKTGKILSYAEAVSHVMEV